MNPTGKSRIPNSTTIGTSRLIRPTGSDSGNCFRMLASRFSSADTSTLDDRFRSWMGSDYTAPFRQATQPNLPNDGLTRKPGSVFIAATFRIRESRSSQFPAMINARNSIAMDPWGILPSTREITLRRVNRHRWRRISPLFLAGE